jgi:hypothetical protein
MSDIEVAEILKHPTEERLRLVELIWKSLSQSPTAVPLSDFHYAVIDERLAEQGPRKKRREAAKSPRFPAKSGKFSAIRLRSAGTRLLRRRTLRTADFAWTASRFILGSRETLMERRNLPDQGLSWEREGCVRERSR